MKALPTSAPQRCYLLLLLCLAGCQPAARVWDGDVVISERSISQSLRQLVAIEGNLIVSNPCRGSGSWHGLAEVSSSKATAGCSIFRDSKNSPSSEAA